MKVLLKPRIVELQSEFRFTTSRGGGPGGQHVNKVNTKVTLHWSIVGSKEIDEEQRNVMLLKLRKNINTDGEIVLSSHASRSQLKNKHDVVDKLAQLFEKAFAFKKLRKKTKPSKASVRRRLDNKKKLGEKKRHRRDPI